MSQFEGGFTSVPTIVSGVTGSLAFMPSGIPTSSYALTGSDLETFIIETASYIIDGVDNEFKIKVPSTSSGLSEDVIPLFVTYSGVNPQIGIGTSTPQTLLDIEEVKDDSVGTRILLKSARTAEGAQIGDAAGSIIFAIDSASFNDIFSTGSVAEITTIVKGTLTDNNADNMSGNIILKSSPEWQETLIPVAEFGFIKRDGEGNDSSAVGIISGSLIVGGDNQSQGDLVGLEVYSRTQTSDNSPTLQLELNGSDFSIKTGSLDVAKTITSNGYNVVSQSGAFTTNEFIVAASPHSVTSSDALVVNPSGGVNILGGLEVGPTLQFQTQSTPPTAVAGALYVDSNNNLYIGQ